MRIGAPEQRVGESGYNPHEGMAHLFTDILPAVCTLLGTLDDWVLGDETPHPCEKIEDRTKGDKTDNAVEEGATEDKM